MSKNIKFSPEQVGVLKNRVKTMYDDAYGYMTMKQYSYAGEAWQYYHGELPKVDLEGGDEYVERVVEECVNSVLQDLLTVFTSQDDAVVIEPSWDLPTEVAQALTDRVNKLLVDDNDGYTALHDAWKEMLVARNGFVKVWWENKELHKADSIEGVPAAAVIPYLEGVRSNPSIKMKEEDVEITEYEDGAADVSIKYIATVGRLKVMYVPFNDMIINEGARTIKDANYVCQRIRKSKAEMIDEGYDPDIVAELNYDNTEVFNLVTWDKTNGAVDPFQDNGYVDNDYAGEIWVNEHYIRTAVLDDKHEDRLYQVVECQGNIFSIEEVEFIPFISFTCLPLPGVVFGESITDLTRDLQDTQSRLMRATIDNAQYITYGRYLADTNKVDMRALLDNTPGGVIPVEAGPAGVGGAVQMLQEAQLPQSVALAMQNIEFAKEARTGVSKTSQGLSKDMLKGDHGFDTVSFLVSQSQGRSRMMARNVARNYAELIRMMVSYIRDNSTVPLTVNTIQGPQQFLPQAIPHDISIKIKPALSAADKQEEAQKFLQTLQGLQMISGQQAMFAGPQQRYMQSAKWVELNGYKDVNTFLMGMQEYQAPQPSPMDIANLQKVQAEAEKIANESQAIMHKAGLEQNKFEVDTQIRADEQSRLENTALWNAQNMADQNAIQEAIAISNADESLRKSIQKEQEQRNREFREQVDLMKSEAEIKLRSRELDIQELNAIKDLSITA